MNRVLVLNASYEPLNIASWKRAVVLLIKEKADQVENSNAMLRFGFPLPSVIRLRNYIQIPYKEIPLTRRNVLHRDNHTCQYCGHTGESLTLDHVIPRSRGGKETWDNMITACLRCNVKKGNRTPREAEMSLSYPPRRPYSSLHFEVVRHLNSGNNQEWRKYMIGLE